MKRYFLYDNVLQSEKAPSIAVATRALFDFLNLTIPRLQEAKADLGSEIMALDKNNLLSTMPIPSPLHQQKMLILSVLKTVGLSL